MRRDFRFSGRIFDRWEPPPTDLFRASTVAPITVWQQAPTPGNPRFDEPFDLAGAAAPSEYDLAPPPGGRHRSRRPGALLRHLRWRRVVASQSTSARSARIPACASAPRQARRVAPVVTTSSTSTTAAPAGGRCDSRTRSRPARLATRCAASSPTESRARRANRSGRATCRSGRPAASSWQSRATWSPPRALAAAGRDGAGTNQTPPGPAAPVCGPRSATGSADQLGQRGVEQLGERSGQVPSIALLVAQQRGPQRALVPPDRDDHRPARDLGGRRRTELWPAGGAPRRSRRGAACAVVRQHQVDQRRGQLPHPHLPSITHPAGCRGGLSTGRQEAGQRSAGVDRHCAGRPAEHLPPGRLITTTEAPDPGLIGHQQRSVGRRGDGGQRRRQVVARPPVGCPGRRPTPARRATGCRG